MPPVSSILQGDSEAKIIAVLGFRFEKKMWRLFANSVLVTTNLTTLFSVHFLKIPIFANFFLRLQCVDDPVTFSG